MSLLTYIYFLISFNKKNHYSIINSPSPMMIHNLTKPILPKPP